VLIDERDGCTTPVDHRIVAHKPRHPEDNIVTMEVGHGEVQTIGIAAEADGDGRKDTSGRLTATVGEGDGVGRARGHGEAVSLGVTRRSELAGRAAVDQGDSRVTSDGTGDLDERVTGLGELIDLHP
jgi:hypothetical protein